MKYSLLFWLTKSILDFAAFYFCKYHVNITILNSLEFQIIYDQLDITLIERGESFYNDLMPKVVEKMKETGEA